MYSASADGTASVWDVSALRRVRRYTEHQSFVNSCSVSRTSPQLLLSGSDDKTAKVRAVALGRFAVVNLTADLGYAIKEKRAQL